MILVLGEQKTYLANSCNSRVNTFTTVYVFHCTFSEEKVNVIANIERADKIWFCLRKVCLHFSYSV